MDGKRKIKVEQLMADFLRQSKMQSINCGSMLLEDEMFYNLKAKWVDRMIIGNTEVILQTPRWFVSFTRDHQAWQLEIALTPDEYLSPGSSLDSLDDPG